MKNDDNETRRGHSGDEWPAWQPIDTAPRDGTRVLTFRRNFGECMAVAWFDAIEGEWRPVNGGVWPEPSHWQPLPRCPR